MSDSIKVAIKVRPLIKREKEDNLSLQWTVQGNSILAVDPELRKRGDGGFHFDHIFDANTTNPIIFNTIVKPIVDAAVNGFNGTVFAYGQTSSGKTYTMMGTPEEPGVIALAIDHIFNAIANSIGREFLLRVSYLEIYNERVNDLLDKGRIDLKIHEDTSGQVIVHCKEEVTNCPESVLSIMKKGNKNKRIGETNMNERSSRSHTIFRITIESREAGTDSDGAIQVSQLNLVDLAGSERARQTGATGERFKEGRHINLSLSTLGLVIMQLSESQDNQKHVNYRDSKLTRLLQASLGGNAMTAIICAVTPAAVDETQCTLSFASRAKSIKTKPQLNEVMSDTALLKRYARQIEKLNAEMEKVKNEKEKSDGYNQLLEERLELLQTKIVSGDMANHEEESFKCKSKRRRTWGGPSTFKHPFPVFQRNRELPTIKEMSPEKTRRKSIIQSVDIMNQTFQTAFADFELELLESERDRDVSNDGSDSDDDSCITKRRGQRRVQFLEDVISVPENGDNFNITPEKKSKEVQTLTMQESPSTPKHVLREIVSDLTEKYNTLREFSKLEKQLICEEKDCCQHAEDLKQFDELKYQLQNNHTNCLNDKVAMDLHNNISQNISELRENLKISGSNDVPELVEHLKVLGLSENDNLENVLKCISIKFQEINEYNNSKIAKDLNFSKHKPLNEIPGLNEHLHNLDIKEENTVEDVVTLLCKKLTDIESQNKTGMANNDQLQKRISALEGQIQFFVSERTNLCKELSDRTSELESMKSKNLDGLLTKQKELVESMEKKNKDLDEQCVKYQADLAKVKSENENLLQQIAHQEEFLGDIQRKNMTLRKTVMQQEETMRTLQENNNALKIRVADQDRILEEVRAKNIALEDQLNKQTEPEVDKTDNNQKQEVDTTDNNQKEEDITQKQDESTHHNDTEGTILNDHFDNSEVEDSSFNVSKIIVDLEHEKVRLTSDLEMKNQELEEIKNDVQSMKLDIVKLDQTIQMLTNENMELHTILSKKKEQYRDVESNFQKTITDLYANVSTLTNEKINLQTELQIANEQLRSLNSKTPEQCNNDNSPHSKYSQEIEKLKAENIQLISLIEDKNKEIESFKESKSLLFDHECMYKDKVAVLTERNDCLTSENDELSTDLMDKIEDIEALKKECDALKEKLKVSLADIANSTEDDAEQLRVQNNMLKAEIVDLKTKVTMLSDENTTFSNNLIESMEDLSNLRNESIYNATLHLSTVFDSNLKSDEDAADTIIKEGNRDVLVKEILKLREEVSHLNRLNQKLSDLKLKTCTQCAHLQSLKENHRSLKLETKSIAHRFKDLQKKFDRKCEEVETLKVKAYQDINLSQLDASFNTSFQDALSVSFVEEKIDCLSNELKALKEANDHLVNAYKDKCEEFDKIQVEAKSTKTDDELKSKKSSKKNENRYEEIQKAVHRVSEDIDEMKKDYKNWNSVLSRYKDERSSLVEEITMLKGINEQLSQKATENEMSATTYAEKAQMLENEVLNMTKEIQDFIVKDKQHESEKLTLEVAIEELKSEKENRDTLIAKLHQTIDELNESLSTLKNELESMNTANNELISTKETMTHKHNDEVQQLKKQCDELENEKKHLLESEQRLLLKEKDLESEIQTIQMELTKQKDACSEHSARISELEQCLKENCSKKEALQENLNSMEAKYKDEVDAMNQKLVNNTKKSEDEIKAIKEEINQYIQENNKLTQELVRLRDIEEEYQKNKHEVENKTSREEALVNDNQKLKSELSTARECIIKELKSLKRIESTMDLLSKPVNETFVIFLQTLVAKEEEIVKAMREQFEKDKQMLEDEKRQSLDAEKRAQVWVKELEAEIGKLQSDLTKREQSYTENQDKISQLSHLLRESNHERDMLREKVENLETDLTSLQMEYDKQQKTDAKQEEAIFIAQKREKEAQEVFKAKEHELQTKLKADKEMYESRIQDLTSTVEMYKMKNMELKSNLEGFEANEKQLKNIIDANSIELKKNGKNIEKLNAEIEQLSEAYNSANRHLEEKKLKIEEITALLKSKCDMLSEYKAKLDVMSPEYDLLKEQVAERKASLERHTEELQNLKIEKEKELEIIQDKLSSEEVKNVGLQKQLTDLNNRNVALIGQLDDLKDKYEALQQENAKLERKMRNSTSKLKAEAEIDDLRDVNKRLQSNLDGASNRITELQESKNQLFKELVGLKGEFDLLNKENTELKRTIASYELKASVSNSCIDNERYDNLLHEKNKIALELEGKKLLISQKDKRLERYEEQIDELMQKNKDLDKELDEYAEVIRSRDNENAKLQEKLYAYLSENTIVNELETKVKSLQLELDMERKQLEGLKTQNEKLYKDAKVVYKLKNENAELMEKINELEGKNESKSNSSGSRCTSPAFDNTRRRHSRNEIFNQKRQLDTMATSSEDCDIEERCQILRRKIRELELQLVTKNGKIAALEVQVQSENFPYQRKCTELHEKLLAYKKSNAELNAEITKLQRIKVEMNSWDCETCRRWRVNRRDQACQTIPDNSIRLSGMSSGVVDDFVSLTKLEKQNKLAKELCRSRSRRIKELESRIKELEEAQTPSTSSVLRPMEVHKGTSNQQQILHMYPERRLDFDKISKPFLKENVPANILEARKFRMVEDTSVTRINRGTGGPSYLNKI